MKKMIFLPIFILITSCSGTKVTLLPDAAGNVGHVIVKNEDNQPVTLTASGQTIDDSILGEHQSELSAQEARQQRPALFKAEPAALSSQIVWFAHDSIKPLSSQKQLISSVRNDCQRHAPCQITVIGHTDGIGDEQYNMALSLRRAKVVQNMLINAGFPKSAMDIRYHGPFDPLIKTPLGRQQPKNRRVEIMVH